MVVLILGFIDREWDLPMKSCLEIPEGIPNHPHRVVIDIGGNNFREITYLSSNYCYICK
jgi:hypothetical protein